MNLLLIDRTVEGNPLCRDGEDLERFESLLDMVNSNIELPARWWRIDTSSINRGIRIVDVVNYYIGPDYAYILLRTDDAANKSRFMLRLKTAYTMYYKHKYKRDEKLFCTRSRVYEVPEIHMDRAISLLASRPEYIRDVRMLQKMLCV